MTIPTPSERPRLYELLEAAPPEATLFLLPDGTRYSYERMQRESRKLAAVMHSEGLRRGDAVALCLGNQIEWMVVAFAAWRLGVAVLALNPRLGSKEIGDLISRTQAKALFFAPGHRDGATAEIYARIPPEQKASIKLIFTCDGTTATHVAEGRTCFDLHDLPNAPDVPVLAKPQDACLFMATSGTTSLPKIVQHQQDRVFGHAHSAGAAIGYGPKNTVLLAIPFCGGFGFAVAITAIAQQTTILLMESFEARLAVELVNRYKVSHGMGPNDILQKMLQTSEATQPFPSMSVFGHAAFTPGLDDLPERAQARGVQMRGFYGLSETLAFVAARELDAPEELRALGGGALTAPGAKLRILDPDNGQEAPFGQAGEVQIYSPYVMTGYLNDPEKTAAAFTSDGYLRTGDLGQQDGPNSFTFLTRMNDTLRIGGYLVAPEEIEEVIKSDTSVRQCLVVAANTSKGARPVAFVQIHAGKSLNSDDLTALCRAQLAAYKIPVLIIALEQIPVIEGPNGDKVKKDVLRNIAARAITEACL